MNGLIKDFFFLAVEIGIAIYLLKRIGRWAAHAKPPVVEIYYLNSFPYFMLLLAYLRLFKIVSILTGDVFEVNVFALLVGAFLAFYASIFALESVIKSEEEKKKKDRIAEITGKKRA